MDEIKPNMYVRTKMGYIARCTYIDKELENIWRCFLMLNIEWRPVKGYERLYEVSNDEIVEEIDEINKLKEND